jgi:peptidoglycan/LPS O-acetylase OafA/YrhL
MAERRGDSNSWRLGHQPALDGLRGVAIATVVMFHLAPSAFPGGKIGVDLFFVLSGFLITSLLIQEHRGAEGVGLGAFYGRRARRLLPALALMLAVIATVLAIQGDWHRFLGLGYVVGYVANWARAGGNLPGVVAHCWSLSIEEQFYVVWPLVIVLLLRSRRRGLTTLLIAVTIVGVMLHRVAGNTPTQSDIGTDVRIDGLLVGCLLACLFAWYGAAKWNWRLPALCAAPLLVSEVLQPRELRGYGYTIVAVLLASLLAAAITWSPLQRALSIRSLGWLGLISYSLYLWHYPVIFWLRGSTDGGIYNATVANVVIALAASIALACASYYLVERRFIRRRATAPEEPAAA